MCTAKFESITPVLAVLHWLPIKARITYKVALLTRKVLTTQKPGYLSSLIRANQPTRHLRPSTHRVLCSTAPRNAFASRAFCQAAPAVWNKLPNFLHAVHSTVSLSEFKRNLKSFLYKHSFPVWSCDWSEPAILLKSWWFHFVLELTLWHVISCLIIIIMVMMMQMLKYPYSEPD